MDPAEDDGRPAAGAGDGFRVGLCTVTFRALDLAEVVRVAADAGVEVLEWGGDVHVPPGDPAAAARARRLTAAAGMSVLSYGSYLFLDDTIAGGPSAGIDAVLDTAVALGARWVRVWAGTGVEPDATGADWDPSDPARELADLAALAPRLAHLHVYDWDPDGTRHSLDRTRGRWVRRARAAVAAGGAVPAGAPRGALVEFLPDDDPAALAGEVAVLRHVLAAAGVPGGAAGS